MKIKLLFFCLLAGAAASLAGCGPPIKHYAIPADLRYAITDLGALDGSSSKAHGLNDLGQVVGQAETSQGGGGGYYRAYVWTNGKMRDFTDRDSEAYAINDLGQTVGGAATSGDGGYSHAFLWDKGKLNDLGTLGGMSSTAYSINNAGQVVGWSGLDAESSDMHAFLWQNGRMSDLGTLGGSTSRAWDINNRGQVVGTSENAGEFRRGFLWQAGRMIEIGTLGGKESNAYAINDAGQAVGWAGIHPDRSIVHAFEWRDGKMRPIADRDSKAYGINNRGQAVGEVSTRGYESRAVVWRDGRLIDLNVVIPPGSGWVLTEARGINDRGQIIGVGRIENRERGFLLTPVSR